MCWSVSENSGDPFSFSFISIPSCFGAPRLFIRFVGAPFIPLTILIYTMIALNDFSLCFLCFLCILGHSRSLSTAVSLDGRNFTVLFCCIRPSIPSHFYPL